MIDSVTRRSILGLLASLGAAVAIGVSNDTMTSQSPHAAGEEHPDKGATTTPEQPDIQSAYHDLRGTL